MSFGRSQAHNPTIVLSCVWPQNSFIFLWQRDYDKCSGCCGAGEFTNPSFSSRIRSLNPFAPLLRHVALSHQNSSHHKLLLCIPARPPDQLHELNYRAKKSLSGIKIQGIDGAIDTLQPPIVSSPVHMSIGVVKSACCFQVSSPAAPQVIEWDQWQQGRPSVLFFFFFSK